MFNIWKCLFPCFYDDNYEPIEIKKHTSKYYAEGNRFIENNEL